MDDKQKKYPTHGISWPKPELLEQAKARAALDGRSLSDYIRRLIQQDVDNAAAALQDAPRAGRMEPARPIKSYLKDVPPEISSAADWEQAAGGDSVAARGRPGAPARGPGPAPRPRPDPQSNPVSPAATNKPRSGRKKKS